MSKLNYKNIFNKELESAGYPTGKGVTESGRSMVEMLGVLAVMGVLSVGGVAMYTSAMNRHRANEIINEANKRAVTIAAQFSAGRTTASLNEFSLYSSVGGVTFNDQDPVQLNRNQFILNLTSLPSTSVCQYIKSMIGSSSLRAINSNCSRFFYNADLSTDSINHGENIGAKGCSANNECSTNQFCYNGKCISRCQTGAYWSKNLPQSDLNCADGLNICRCGRLPEENPICSVRADCSGKCCVVDPDGIKRCAAAVYDKPCPTTNVHCGSNDDCDIPFEFCTLENTGDAHNPPIMGTCNPLNKELITYPPEGTNTVQTYIASPSGMSWWSADNYCKALGKRLLATAELRELVEKEPETFAATSGGFWTSTIGQRSYSGSGRDDLGPGIYSGYPTNSYKALCI